jgi:histidinol dehydrogenase
MIKKLTVPEARKSILRRRTLNRIAYSPVIIERTEAYFGAGVTPPQAVEMILQSVEEDGDIAVKKWSSVLDNVTGQEIEVSKVELQKAWDELPSDLQRSLQVAQDRILDFHEKQPIHGWITSEMGGEQGQRFTPIERVGVYVPGGTAPLPSSLLMSVIPAQVAGVKHISIATPPKAASVILAAAYLCQIDTVYQIGGAQAIGAMAFGTESVQKVDKIVGAGNLFVTLAKQQLYGVVGLDGLAGPTETVVIADHTADPRWVAADLLAQAEHDVQASAILLTPDSQLAERVKDEVSERLSELTRREIIQASLDNMGGIVITETIDQAAELADEYAPEHLCLAVRDPKTLMEKIQNAGGFFLGDHSFEVLGDYIAGPSHIMPTGGTARFASPLNVLDFLKLSSVIALDPETAISLSPTAANLARAEGLTAHAAAAEARLEGS